MSHNPKCPRCNSENWYCWEESNEIFKDNETEEVAHLPVGYLKCRECGAAWTDHDFEDTHTYLGRDEDEAFGWEDYPDRI